MIKQIYPQVLLITLLVCIAACSKKPSPAPTVPQLRTTLKFTGNGTFVEWNGSAPLGTSLEGSIIQKYTSSDPAIPINYTMFSHPAGGGLYSPLLALKMKTNNLIAGTYTTTTATTVVWNLSENICIMPAGDYYASSEAGDFIKVIITSIHDGSYADGTFTALMTNSPDGTSNKLNIANGEFHNVKIDQ